MHDRAYDTVPPETVKRVAQDIANIARDVEHVKQLFRKYAFPEPSVKEIPNTRSGRPIFIIRLPGPDGEEIRVTTKTGEMFDVNSPRVELDTGN